MGFSKWTAWLAALTFFTAEKQRTPFVMPSPEPIGVSNRENVRIDLRSVLSNGNSVNLFFDYSPA